MGRIKVFTAIGVMVLSVMSLSISAKTKFLHSEEVVANTEFPQPAKGWEGWHGQDVNSEPFVSGLRQDGLGSEIMQFDSLNVRFIGNWPFGPPNAVASDSARNIVFSGSGGGVYIVDISTPSNPVKVCEKIHTRGRVGGLFYVDSTLYIACKQGGLEIWDVTNLNSPSKLGCCFTPGSANDVVLSGSYAYVADAYGFAIIDVSNPSNPLLVSTYFGVLAENVALSGSYAYVVGNPDLHILDISDPFNPQCVGSYPGLFHDVTVSSSYAGVVSSEDVRIIDISNPSNPYLVGSYNTPAYTYSVAVSGGYAYIANRYSGLRVINISNPYSPQEVSCWGSGGTLRDVVVSGSYAYVTDLDSGFRIIDVSNLSNLQQVGFLCDTLHPAHDVAIFGSYAYVGYGNCRLRVIDVSNPSNPQEVGYYDTPGWASGVAVSGSHVYVADGIIGLQVYENLLGVEEESSKFKLESAKLEVWPNPFIQSTVISYQLPEDGGEKREARIEIYDVAARIVETFDHLSNQSANQITWDGKDNKGSYVVQGIYFCVLDAGKTKKVHKLIVMK